MVGGGWRCEGREAERLCHALGTTGVGETRRGIDPVDQFRVERAKRWGGAVEAEI